MSKIGLSLRQRFVKRSFDFLFSFAALIIFMPVILLAWIASSISTRSNGLFVQKRVGRGGLEFNLLKIKTMVPIDGVETTVTTSNDSRLTRLGKFLRRTKIDELPQLWNVLLGDMSFVGPRPDVPGYADKLEGNEQIILSVKPGITGPATIKYRNEEALLALQEDPIKYNDEIIWPDKVTINLDYIQHYSFARDIKYILESIST